MLGEKPLGQALDGRRGLCRGFGARRVLTLHDGGEHQERFLARCLDCPGRAILLSYGDINGLNIEQLISGFVQGRRI
jgi:hypothetical protein